MTAIVCKICGSFVRFIPPMRSNRVVKGFCNTHMWEFRANIQQEIDKVRSLSDFLESCLVKRPNPHDSLIDELSIRYLKGK